MSPLLHSETTLVPDEPAGFRREADLAIILPAYNEIAGIERTLARVRDVLAGLDLLTELIVVDDGSVDGTGERAAACGVRASLMPPTVGMAPRSRQAF